ncbi:hypothetical protein PAPYR_13428 [Paratrimastix pyriformis]|uniref:Uncharacterized protein n=1 Tax=Paratrimastix pyriformis TaxID=342808 RepID=A0ABQ8U096_9EUKA|nr:hypothetical protein PAPYR_13428 [Paratrimastix pyriformis]
MRSSSGNALTPSTSGVLRDRSLLERDYWRTVPQVPQFRTSTCSRELPTLWDFLLTGPLPLPLPVLVAEPEPVPESRLDVFSRKGGSAVHRNPGHLPYQNEMVAPRLYLLRGNGNAPARPMLETCGRSLVLRCVARLSGLTRPVKVPVRSASREWRCVGGWPQALRRRPKTWAGAAEVAWSLQRQRTWSPKVALFRWKEEKPGGYRRQGPAAKLASVFEGSTTLQRVTPASARPLVTSPTPLCSPRMGGEECPWRGTAAVKTASATDTAKSKRKPSPSGSDVRRTRITTRMHGHGSSHR